MTALAPWLLLRTDPGAHATPSGLPADGAWLPAIVPGTVGAALQAARRWRPEDAVGFDGFDWWYVAEVEGDGPTILSLDGLATIAEVFLDEALVLLSDSMFVRHEIELPLAGRHRLAIAFRSLDGWLAGRKGRARWRPRLFEPPTLRFARTLLLGRVPGWGPPVQAVGPTRELNLVPVSSLRVLERRLQARISDGDGLLDVVVRLSRPVSGWVTARCGAIDFVLVDEGDGWLRGRVELPDVEPWWPHTHGRPALHPVAIEAGGERFDLGRVGFRTLELDRGADGHGFGLVANGTPVFCRGACWTSSDIVALPTTREAIAPLLTLARDAGMNMIRVGATMGYECDGFHALCDELGLMVWQDFAFSNFDYPAGDPAFCAAVEAEARHLLHRLQGSPSLAVLCGGSEVAQQAAMLGMPAALWSNRIFDELLPRIAAEARPDVPYLPNTPWGGDLPFVADRGVSHYYGLSAHRRPLAEARRAGVRFSAESLGLANVPDGVVTLEPDRPACVHLDVVERHPHDVAASWAFEDIRNHYTEALYGVDVAALRRADPERFLSFARATSAELMADAYAEWRREGSPTRGVLVWWLRDLAPGAGWGLIDASGVPKAAYWGCKRVFRPVGLVLTDENLNGLRLHLFNETAEPSPVRLRLRCLRDGETAVMEASAEMVLQPRLTIALAATTLFGGFFDTTYAFRFGEPAHDVTVASLHDAATGALLAEAFHFPLGRGHERRDLGLAASLSRAAEGWRLTVTTRRLAQSVRVRCDGVLPSDNYFHLAPGEGRTLSLAGAGDDAPSGTVEALDGLAAVAFAMQPPNPAGEKPAGA